MADNSPRSDGPSDNRPPVTPQAQAWLDRARAVWDERAARWDVISRENTLAPDRAADLERTIDALRVSPGDRVLDAGCGSGQFAIAFAERGMRLTGVDLAPAMIERARAHAAGRGLAIEWRIEHLAQISDPAAVYAAIHCRAALQFVPDVVATLREFRRLLRPGGRLYASVPGALSPIYRESWRRHLDPDLGLNYLVPWELEQLLTDDGWSVIDGWGEYGTDISQEATPFSHQQLAALDPRLRQAAATTWTIIAE